MMKRQIFLGLIIFLSFALFFSGVVRYLQKIEKGIEVQQEQVSVQKPPPKEIEVQIFFGNEKMNPGMTDCKAVFPVSRIIPNDLIIRRRAVEELLKGPRTDEVEQGYYSNIPSKEEIIEFREKTKEETGRTPYKGDEIKINSFKILIGAAFIDFSREILADGDSCRRAAIKAQITETVKQFPNIGGAIISVEGNQQAL